jgi:hypothetical protein
MGSGTRRHVSQVRGSQGHCEHTLLAKVGRRQDTGHGVALGHLLQDLDEEANLHLGCLLQQGVESSSALGLAEYAEPLLDSAELILKILVQCSGGHVLESRLVLVDVGDPLLGGLVGRVVLATHTNAAEVDLAGGADAAGCQRGRGREGAHVGRGAQVVARVHAARRRRAQRRARGIGGAVAVADAVVGRHGGVC